MFLVLTSESVTFYCFVIKKINRRRISYSIEWADAFDRPMPKTPYRTLDSSTVASRNWKKSRICKRWSSAIVFSIVRNKLQIVSSSFHRQDSWQFLFLSEILDSEMIINGIEEYELFETQKKRKTMTNGTT